jgi:hypothetical protein
LNLQGFKYIQKIEKQIKGQWAESARGPVAQHRRGRLAQCTRPTTAPVAAHSLAAHSGGSGPWRQQMPAALSRGVQSGACSAAPATWGYSRVTLGGGLDVLGKGSGSLGVLGKGEEGPRTASPAAELGRQEGRAGAAARHRGEVARLGQRRWRSR